MPYLVWNGAEIATKKGPRNWKCFCGHMEATEHFIRFHLEYEHKITTAELRQDDENYDGSLL